MNNFSYALRRVRCASRRLALVESENRISRNADRRTVVVFIDHVRGALGLWSLLRDQLPRSTAIRVNKEQFALEAADHIAKSGLQRERVRKIRRVEEGPRLQFYFREGSCRYANSGQLDVIAPAIITISFTRYISRTVIAAKYNARRRKVPCYYRIQLVELIRACLSFLHLAHPLRRRAAFPCENSGRHENTCQALQCPEDHNMTTLVPVANHKYYSMYPVFVPPGNCTYEYQTVGITGVQS